MRAEDDKHTERILSANFVCNSYAEVEDNKVEDEHGEIELSEALKIEDDFEIGEVRGGWYLY